MSRSLNLRNGKITCPSCGKPTSLLLDGVCPRCYVKEHRLVEIRKSKIEITVCRNCGAYVNWKGKWVRRGEFDVENVVKEFLKTIYRPVGVIQRTELERIDENKFKLKVYGKVHPMLEEYYWEEYPLEVVLNLTLCPNCLNLLSKHEEARIQIRAFNRELGGAERSGILKSVEEILVNIYDRDSAAQPLKVEESENGIDIVFTSKRVARDVVSKLSSQYFFDVLETSKDIGRDDSGRVKRRTTYRILLPPFREHDIVKYRDKVYFITRISKNRVFVFDLETYSRSTLTLSKNMYKDANVIARASELEDGIVVSIDGPYVQVMSLANYEVYEVFVKASEKYLEYGEKIKIFKRDDRVFIIPYSFITEKSI